MRTGDRRLGDGPASEPARAQWNINLRNLLKFLLTSLSLPAVGRLRFAEMETTPPFETGRLARPPSALSLETETGHQPARAAQASEKARENRPAPFRSAI
jgi:hypothetical protein